MRMTSGPSTVLATSEPSNLVVVRDGEPARPDREMLEAMAADADQAENLYQHDLGVVRLRRLYHKLAEEQATRPR